MSLITRCPACGTMFKVVPDQLKVSQGWVRCGHCADVFDASLNMQAPALAASSPPFSPSALAPAYDQPVHGLATRPFQPFGESSAQAVAAAFLRPSAPADSGPQAEPENPEADWQARTSSGYPADATPFDAATDPVHPVDQAGPWDAAPLPSMATPVQPMAHTLVPDERPAEADNAGLPVNDFDPAAWKRQYSALDQVGALRRNTSGEAERESPLEVPETGNSAIERIAAAEPQVRATASVSNSFPDPLEDEHQEQTAHERNDVSFVRQARRKAFWRQPAVRLASGVVALLLLASLLLQTAFHQRDAIAAGLPQLRPALQTMCARLGCEIGQLRHIESIVIDSSSFNRIGPDAYRLGFSIRNTGDRPLAMPALEVTLTDTQERAVVRRVLTPAQFGAGGAPLQPGSDFSGSVALQVSADESGALTSSSSRVAGYRVLAFYP